MKKLIVILSLIIASIFMVSCSTSTATISYDAVIVSSKYETASAENFGTDGTTLQFISGNYRLDFNFSNGYYLVLANKTANLFKASTPIKIHVKTNAGLSNNTEKVYTAKYLTVTKTSYGYSAIGYVKTDNGSVYRVTDNYSLVNGNFVNDREVKVLFANKLDYGFASEYTFLSATSKSISDYKVFIPGSVYNSTGYYEAVANKTQLQRETDILLPMVMLYESSSGESFTMQHYKPQISSIYGGGVDGQVDSNIQFGSMGYACANTTMIGGISYVYPSSENKYIDKWTQSTTARRIYHENVAGFSHTYQLALELDNQSTYVDAQTESYETAYFMENPTVDKKPIDTIYEQNIDLFSGEYKEFGTGSQKSAGVPFSIDVAQKGVNQGYSFCSCFVGQQIPIGYQLYYYGAENNNATIKAQGKTILDFWSSSNIVTTGKFNYWKWTAGNNANGGKVDSNESGFYSMRYIVDGSEGMLEAYKYAKSKGNDYSAWKTAAINNADLLCQIQNTDGSFYRIYNKDGTAYDCTGSTRRDAVQSFESTAVPVRYLYRCYKLTGDIKYKTCADKAIEYVYKNLYPLGYYVGGAADDNNIIDKEGAAFAIYAFSSAYQITGEEKYLKAMKSAAVTMMSFVYCYDYKVPNYSESSLDNKYNPYVNGGVIGGSRLYFNNDCIDNFAAYMYYEYYKMYLLSNGDSFYLSCAKLLQNATKNCCDYDSRVGYVYPAMTLEATSVSRFCILVKNSESSTFTTTSTWLPWSGIAMIEPMTNMKLTFGTRYVENVSGTVGELRATLIGYGV